MVFFHTQIKKWRKNQKINQKNKNNKKKNQKKKKLDENEFFKNIEHESKGINYELFEKHFNNVVPSALAKKII